MIDISDGLYQDIGHICQQSSVSMRIHLDQLPTSKALANAELTERLLCQLTGGDDYELAFTLPAHIEPPVNDSSNTPVTCIGEVITVNEPDSIKNLPSGFFIKDSPSHLPIPPPLLLGPI